MSLFVIFKFPASSVPRTSRRRREQNPEDRCRHQSEDIAGDTLQEGHHGSTGQGK
ncbi:unnamed protein product [Staurois parvus]|uniref:Uncharacterized protein n=1 Tax=Staurois parvus TaxID=386267 RepID=A0ABN9DKZ4_9NEOB|nr:unnamed protein product [Staurois parvus]